MITDAVAFGAVVLLVLTLQDVFEVMLLPRRIARLGLLRWPPAYRLMLPAIMLLYRNKV